MKWAIFSDLHGNLPALEKFVELTQGQVDGYICLGDVVNYAPWNDECLEMVVGLSNLRFIEGNHERLFLGTEDVSHEIPLVRDFFTSSKKSFTRRDLISNLPKSFEMGPFTFAHTIGDHNLRVYPDSQIEPDKNYVIGHSHHAFIMNRSGKTVVNPGSLGQNRKRIDRLNYALLNDSTFEFTLCEAEYNVGRVIDEMRARDYPPACIEYYLKKIPAP
ncbi:MAG: metallophosphoesterase family protein [Polyangiaceae bacterium]|nr:metallophosphoesterase family protein [Polyangiaceae bacterium]